MPSETELTNRIIEDEKIFKRLGKSACRGGLIDPTSINKGYCQYKSTFCSKARICLTRREYNEKQKYKS